MTEETSVTWTPIADKHRSRVAQIQEELQRLNEEMSAIVAETLGNKPSPLVRVYYPETGPQTITAFRPGGVGIIACYETATGCGCVNLVNRTCTPCASFP